MTCPECGQTFSAERRPRMLPCGHTFCTPCLIQLHERNSAVIPCTTCDGEMYCENVSEIPVNLWVETHMAKLTLQVDGKDLPIANTDSEDKNLLWNTCAIHNSPMSFWCRTCGTSVCISCSQEHHSQSHQVFSFQETRQLLLSQYENQTQVFLDWLVNVKKVTQQTLKATELLVPVLTNTLSAIEEYTQKMKREKQALEDAPSLETMEKLLNKTSSWCNSNKASLQHQVEKILVLYQRAQSHVNEFQIIHQEMEKEADITKSAKDRTTTIPLSTVPESETSREDTNLIAKANSPLPRQLGRGFSDVEAVNLPGEVSLPFSTQVEIRATGENARCGVLYKAADDALLLCLWCRFHDDLYNIMLDGRYLLSKKKFKHHENTTLCRKIKVFGQHGLELISFQVVKDQTH
ncbi:uncharacterized protein LOC143031170 isoform X2 [Oratosquilla oratoria]|uniref:uncharacterized protein LOC143031170 isoform X2 n=1 Tax=Oratosquilla oratoria TaxID=337810 RepID=UPI003F7701EB